MKVAVIKYNAGNIRSVVNAFRRIGASPVLTDDPEELATADRVVFPGQGEASNTMSYLKSTGLDQIITNLRQPVLGICIGQQLLCAHSEEGETDCLGVLPAPVRRFMPTRHDEKVPHMGWNTLNGLDTPLFAGIPEGSYVYFVHSYYVPCGPYTIAQTNFIVPFSAALRKDNFYATQFHPEKSGHVGEQVLRNFLDLQHD